MSTHASRKFIAIIAMAGMALTTPALAADLWVPDDRGSIKDAPYEPAFSWTGFYIGGHAGLATGNTEGAVTAFGPAIAALTATDYTMNGGIYGGHIGYNYQMGKTVIGIEGTFSGTDIEGETTCLVLLKCQRNVDWVATVVGRLGYTSGNTMFYGLGGVAWGDVQTNVGFIGPGLNFLSGGETHVGWTAGIGIEHAISRNLIVRVEYSHIDLGEDTHTLNFTPVPGLFTVPTEVDATIDTLKVGVSYKF
ncbi:MAG: porin family protein [Hyphomicrobiaceae bacterium]|nr:porin family protein [Hyphomicrobiaceae bacterium]